MFLEDGSHRAVFGKVSVELNVCGNLEGPSNPIFVPCDARGSAVTIEFTEDVTMCEVEVIGDRIGVHLNVNKTLYVQQGESLFYPIPMDYHGSPPIVTISPVLPQRVYTKDRVLIILHASSELVQDYIITAITVDGDTSTETIRIEVTGAKPSFMTVVWTIGNILNPLLQLVAATLVKDGVLIACLDILLPYARDNEGNDNRVIFSLILVMAVIYYLFVYFIFGEWITPVKWYSPIATLTITLLVCVVEILIILILGSIKTRHIIITEKEDCFLLQCIRMFVGGLLISSLVVIVYQTISLFSYGLFSLPALQQSTRSCWSMTVIVRGMDPISNFSAFSLKKISIPNL